MPTLINDLGKVPRHSYGFLWADYVELLCLCSINRAISKGNVAAQTQEASDTQADSEVEEIGLNERPEVSDDRVSQRWDDVHKRLTARSKQYIDWPFELQKNLLRSRFDGANPRHRLYVALLVASSLRLCEKTRSHEVTSAFEEVSYHWLKAALNDLWEVRPFGAHQNLPNAYAAVSLLDKLKALALDIQGRLQKSEESYDPRNSGDGGIDLVAWLRVGDRRGNIPVIFGQCACSPTDWEDKQLDVTPAAIEAHISPQHPGAAYCFVPHDLAENDRMWDRAEHVKKTVLVDRLRLFSLFEQAQNFDRLPTWDFVDEAIQTQAVPAT
jgi:hypothetical protein